MESTKRIFRTSSHKTAWAITAKHLARGQKDPVEMVLDGIEQERKRCMDILRAAGGPHAEVPLFIQNPDAEW
ncbi:hypothetical protein [Sinorhizobium sp. RAC02]|uniref:hypothetical protein n=1 Tax=Sinorhizobium sp. RAC02 TaxID=1842534 RepID=UPI00083D490D|nr:hypothetical protein [Sinorhizobium sp. RAC02]